MRSQASSAGGCSRNASWPRCGSRSSARWTSSNGALGLAKRSRSVIRPTMVDRVLRSVTDFGAAHRSARSSRRRGDLHRRAARHLPRRLAGGCAASPSRRARRRTGRSSTGCSRRPIGSSTRSSRWSRPVSSTGRARLTAAIPPVGDRLSATLRRYTVRNVTLRRSRRRATRSRREAAAFLHAAHAGAKPRSRSRENRVRARPRCSPRCWPRRRAGTACAACEEIRELAVPITHGSYYEVRPPALDGTGEISLRDLVKFVLAMRPDRHRGRARCAAPKRSS